MTKRGYSSSMKKTKGRRSEFESFWRFAIGFYVAVAAIGLVVTGVLVWGFIETVLWVVSL